MTYSQRQKAQLNYAVAQAVAPLGNPQLIGDSPDDMLALLHGRPFEPCTDWNTCGPLLEQFAGYVECTDVEAFPRYWQAAIPGRGFGVGPDPLIAICAALANMAPKREDPNAWQPKSTI